MRFFLLLLFCLQAQAAEPFQVDIRVEQPNSGEFWQVRHTASKPMQKLIFQRRTNLFRQANWIVKTPGLAIEQENGREVLVARNGKPIQPAELALKPYFQQLIKDYEFFLPFTDGSLLLYTGHFNVLAGNNQEPAI